MKYIFFFLFLTFIIEFLTHKPKKRYRKKKKTLKEMFETKFISDEIIKYNKSKSNSESNIAKGKNYEIQIGNYYKSLGYKVDFRGIRKGKKDGGIDIIAKNENETLLIQCKNWQSSEVKQKHLKEFIGNCKIYLDENSEPSYKTIRKIFIVSNQNINYGVKRFLKEHKRQLEYKIVEYDNL